MHAQMARFLDAVWDANARSPMADWGPAYDIYVQVVVAQTLTNTSAPALFRYVDDLVALERDNECKVSVQNYEKWLFADLAEYAKGVPRAALPRNLLETVRGYYQSPTERLSDAELAGLFQNSFLGTFYHFEPYRPQRCSQRVYLNVNGDEAVKVMKFVVPSMVPGLPGCSEAKISGPRTAGARADTIVIYSAGETTTNAILERLTEYQRLSAENRARFGAETSVMTEPAQSLVGVSVGAEPKLKALGDEAHQVLARRESFGSMRSKLVFEALRTNPRNKDAFFAAVIRLFGSARLNPMAPHVN